MCLMFSGKALPTPRCAFSPRLLSKLARLLQVCRTEGIVLNHSKGLVSERRIPLCLHCSVEGILHPAGRKVTLVCCWQTVCTASGVRERCRV